jgi:hypothetical protein
MQPCAVSPPKKPRRGALIVVGIAMLSTPWIFEGVGRVVREPVGRVLLPLLLGHGARGVWLFFLGGIVIGVVIACPFVFVFRRWAKQEGRYSRWTRQRCVACDYDIRAQQEGNRCPECGRVIPPRYQPPDPMMPPRRPLTLWLSIPAILAPIGVALAARPILDPYGVTDVTLEFAGLLTVFILAPVLTIHSRFSAWRHHRCIRCRCDLLNHITLNIDGLCPRCGTPIPEPAI